MYETKDTVKHLAVARDEAIMLINLSIILLSNSTQYCLLYSQIVPIIILRFMLHLMLTTYYRQLIYVYHQLNDFLLSTYSVLSFLQ